MCYAFSSKFLFLFTQEDSYQFSRASSSGSACLSSHHPSPVGGWELSHLCSHTDFENTDCTICCQIAPSESLSVGTGPLALRTVPGTRQERRSPATSGTFSKSDTHVQLESPLPSFCGFTHFSSIMNTQLVSLCCLGIVRLSTAPNQKVK